MIFLKKRKNVILITLLFLALFILCFMFPYTHDDWAWGSSIGIERLNSLFYNYNGRWAGNLFVILLTRNNVLKALVMAFSIISICLLSANIINKQKRTNIFILCCSLFLLMPKPTFAQGFAWLSGFTNYVLPMVCVLIYIYLNKNIFEGKTYFSKKSIIPLFALGFIGSLFVEHVTIYNVCLAFACILYTKIKQKKVYLSQIFYMVGSCFGAGLMFSNKAYFSILSSSDTYQSISQDNIIISSIKAYFNDISSNLIFNNVFLNIAIIILLSIFTSKILKKDKVKFKNMIISIYILLCMFTVYNILCFIYPNWNIILNYTKYLNGFLSGGFIILLIFYVFLVIDNKKIKSRMLFSLISIILLTGPLLVVKPIGPRCFVPMYCMWILFTADLYCLSVKQQEKIDLVLVSILIVGLVYLLSIYGYIFKINTIRENYIKSEKENIEEYLNENEALLLPKLPYTDYMQCGNPSNKNFEERFKMFYKINKNIDLKFINFSEWKKVMK